jgi:hypothetical protein
MIDKRNDTFGGIIGREKPNNFAKSCPTAAYFHHKSHMN